jgi:hypothetical protein
MKLLSLLSGLAFGSGTAAILMTVAFFGACGSYPESIPCGQIPVNGCPLRGGGTCDDVTCSAIYGCYDGKWVLTQSCMNMPDADAGPDSGDCPVAMIDHTGETTGCQPDLQNPDCPVQAAEQCASSVCQSECTDFFMCKADGWEVVAYCDQDGQLVLMQ